MEVRKPLTEIGGCQGQRQRPQPRRKKMGKVYGKNKSAFRVGTGLNIFIDENEVTDQLAGMSLKDSAYSYHSDDDENAGQQGGVALMQTIKPTRSESESSVNLSTRVVPVQPTRAKTKKSASKGQQDSPPQSPIAQTGFLPGVLSSTQPTQISVEFSAAITPEEHYVKEILSEARHKSSRGLQSFKSLTNRLARSFNAKKLAEGSYGDCYKLTIKNPSSASSHSLEGVIQKIVPINPISDPASKEFTSTAQVVREVKIHKLLDSLQGFARFMDVHVVQGRYPTMILEEAHKWLAKGDRGYDYHDPFVRFSDEQLFAIFDMSDAGKELERLKKPSAFQIFDIFWTLVILISNAEGVMKFEHRDLHMGNICFKSRRPGGRIDISPMLNGTMTEPPPTTLGLANLRMTIIDYTLARAIVNTETEEVAWHPMDKFPFDTIGRTAEGRVQCSVYRRMRDCVRKQDAKAEKYEPGIDPWSRFVPKTNVCWLVFVLVILTSRSPKIPLEGSSPASQLLQARMFGSFEKIVRLYQDCTVGKLPESAADLLGEGLANGWIEEGDVVALKEYLEESGA